jgi:PKD repeat protein
MKRIINLSWAIAFLLIVTQMISCKKDKTEADFIASFSYKTDPVDYRKVKFHNLSIKSEKLSWDFGDSTAISAEANPVHTYSTIGVYIVKLTSTSPGGLTNAYSVKIIISDPNAELTKLVGDSTKTWKLLRNGVRGNSPLQVGPFDRSTIWWFVDATELPKRSCMLNDEWTFKRNGMMNYNANGDFWGEANIFAPGNTCQSTDVMIAISGEDCSAWGNGNHRFRLTTGSNPKITAIGKGAFIGFFKSATEYEVSKLTPMVQDSITYNVVKIYDGVVDTLIVEADYKFELGNAAPGGYWRYVLVHYDNPADEPPMP